MQFRSGFEKLLLSNEVVAEFTQTTLKCQGAIYLGLVKRGHIAVSLGAQIPVAGERPFDYRVVSFLL